ncbi:MAG: hypothetical protein ACU4F9_10045 [Arcticibacter sp.]
MIAAGFLVIASFVLFRLFFQHPQIKIPAVFDISAFRQLPSSDKCFQSNFDFESQNGPNIKSIKREGQNNPTNVFAFTDSLEYGPTFSSKIKSICETSRIGKLAFACDVFAPRKDLPVPVVVSIEYEGKSLYWKSINIPFVDSQWKNVNLEFVLPADAMEPEAELKVYIWNNSKHSFMIDNMRVDFIAGGTEIQTYGFYPERHVSLDFDTPIEQEISNVHTNGPSRSGKGSCKLGFFNPFSPVITRRVGAVADGPMKDVTVRAVVFPAYDNPKLYFAVSLSDSSGKEYFFKARSDSRKFEGNRWNPMKAKMDLPAELIKPNDVISVYVWNKGFQNVYIDDFEVQFAESNKRVGVKPIIDMYGYGEGGYDFKANVPPFRKKTLSAFQITGVYASFDSTIVDFKDKPINAFDKISVGKFGASGANQSQLVVLRNQNLLFLGLCNGDSKWSLLARVSVPNIQGLDLVNSNWLVQDVNDDGYDELIVHTKGKNYLHVLNPDRNRQTTACDINFSATVSAVKLPLDASISKSKYSLVACDDFVGAKGCEFLFADLLTGNFMLLDAACGLVSKGRSDGFKSPKPQEFIADQVQLFSVNDKKQLAIRPDESSGYRYFKFNETGTVLIEQKVPGSDLIPFLGCDAVMDFPDSKTASILFHRTVPKFGLFAVSCDPVTGFVIQNEFEFSGYPEQRNPKYYEKRILFPGDFTGGGKKELLIISSNCGDSNYNGNKCDVPDYSTSFPPVSFIFTID